MLAYFEFKKQEYGHKRKGYLMILDSCIGHEKTTSKDLLLCVDRVVWSTKISAYECDRTKIKSLI